ncbi:type II secretion system protein J [Chloroflexota bacterium]
MANTMVRIRRKWGGQAGFTLAEMMVAVAISSIIVIGSLMFLTYMITVADVNRDKTMASLEVQYVGFWLNEDVVQSQTITLGSDPLDPDDGLLTLEWDDYDGQQRYEIVYYAVETEDGELWRLMRTRNVEVWVEDQYVLDSQQSGTSQVSEYLVPEQTTMCRQRYCTEYGDVHSLRMEVAAKADRSEADSSYEIYPRAVAEWFPQDEEGHYSQDNCYPPYPPIPHVALPNRHSTTSLLCCTCLRRKKTLFSAVWEQ